MVGVIIIIMITMPIINPRHEVIAAVAAVRVVWMGRMEEECIAPGPPSWI